MGLFKKSSHSKNSNTPYQPNNSKYQFIRNDNSTFFLTPVLDDNGMQTYGEFPNNIRIPKFHITIFSENGQFYTQDVFIDINPEFLNNDYYKYLIANLLMPQERMNKILNDYHHYAGGIRFDESGVPGKYIDQNIITILAQREKIAAASQAVKDNEARQALLERLDARGGPNIKTSHAERLTPDKYKEFYGKPLPNLGPDNTR